MLIRQESLGVRLRAGWQKGVSLLELLIAMTISLVVSLAMVTLMANTMGTGKETIEMTRLTEELRTAMQIMSREVRRANFHGRFAACFGNVACRSDGSMEAGADSWVKPITIGTSVSGRDCVFFWYDRDADGNITTDATDYAGAFRRRVVGGVGQIQMTVTTKALASCTAGTWVPITDPNMVNVTEFRVFSNLDSAGEIAAFNSRFTDFGVDVLSYTDTITTAGDTQSVAKVALSLTGVLRRNTSTTKTVRDIVQVRNDIFAPAAGPIVVP